MTVKWYEGWARSEGNREQEFQRNLAATRDPQVGAVSVQAMSWVIEKSTQKGSNLLVLLMIANHADTTGANAYPKVETLAAESRLSERGVRYILSKLVRSSELVLESNAGPYGCHRYSLPGVVLDGFNLRGLPANNSNSSGKSFAPEPKRTEPKDKNLRPLTRSSSTPTCGNPGRKNTATPQQRRFAIVDRLFKAAAEILERKPECLDGDLSEELKQWAANERVPYFDAWPGASTPIEEAIRIARAKRRKTA